MAKSIGRSHNSSWEELAFAEDDAAGSMWPPRSYTCSFCRREFRSAQALGGHMNVHRRDRAMLKQAEDGNNNNNSNVHRFVFPISRNHKSNNDDLSHQESCYTLVFNPNPNSCCYEPQRPNSCVIDLSASSSPHHIARNRQQQQFMREGFSPSSSSFVLEHSKISNKKRKIERDVPGSGCRAKLDLVNDTDLSVSLSLVIRQSLPVASCEEEEETREPEHGIRVRLSCKNDMFTRNEEMIKHRAKPLEDLDLELRLGADPPKVN